MLFSHSKKYDATITELTQAKKVAERGLQDTLTDLEAKESSFRSQYDSLKEQVEPLKKDSLLLNELKTVFNKIQAPGNKPTDQLMNQFMEEKAILTEKVEMSQAQNAILMGKVEVSQAEKIGIKAQFESVQNQLSETQDALTNVVEAQKNLKRKRSEKKSKNKKLKTSDENESGEEENDNDNIGLIARFESVQKQLSETQNALTNALEGITSKK